MTGRSKNVERRALTNFWRETAAMSTDEIVALLHEAAETHHQVFRIVDGDDDDWASWYADWLLNLSELPQLLGTKPVRSHLVHALVQSERDYAAAGLDEPWPQYYAQRLVETFGKDAT
ncbi:MAG TPA: hypothetical protein VFR41_14950 [Acidimicrobiia bacterium]|nr:hypothetical protein [Acidimicrobiia bacterium]